MKTNKQLIADCHISAVSFKLAHIFPTVQNTLTEAADALERCQWKDIDSAPRDGTWVWVFISSVRIGTGKKQGWSKARQVSARWVDNPQDRKGRILSDFALELRDKHGGFWSGQALGMRPLGGVPTKWMHLPPVDGEDGR